jgi:hypothetical protein
MYETPVIFPPGWPRLLTKPKSNRVCYEDKYDGNGVGDFLKLDRTQYRYGDNYVGFFIDQFSRQCPEAIRIFGRKAMVKMNVFSFNIAEIVERLYQDAQINVFFLSTACVPQHANNWNLVR